jgi:hypothetical protein
VDAEEVYGRKDVERFYILLKQGRRADAHRCLGRGGTELGIEFKPNRETLHTADVFKDMKLPREIASEPLFEGEWA